MVRSLLWPSMGSYFMFSFIQVQLKVTAFKFQAPFYLWFEAGAMTLWFVRATPDVVLSETGKAGAIFRASVCSSRFLLLVSRYHFSTCSISKYWGMNPAGMLFLRTLLPINWLAGIGSFFFFLVLLCYWAFITMTPLLLHVFSSTWCVLLTTLVKPLFFTFTCLMPCTPSTASLNLYIVHCPKGMLWTLTVVA